MQSVIDFPWKYAHVVESTVVSDHAAVLHTITINRGATQGTITATVYDGVDATGTVVAIVDVSDTVVNPTTLLFGIAMPDGCYIALSSDEASVDLTASYT